jgi:2-polyprenyl-6-methoxyphenol hydroxylase-like FAD-dependent oxidoreductase
MVLGLLLARAGVEVLVLEKHADFLRDFRGDTVHPSTLQLMHEMGLLERLLRLPHQEWHGVRAWIGDEWIEMADFRSLRTRCRFVAMMPQWDLLAFLANEARKCPAFSLRMSAEATGLLEEDGRVVGVRAQTASGPLEARADLVVAADGRGSRLRAEAGLELVDLGAPIDVLWMRLPRLASDPPEPLARIAGGHFFVLFDRMDYWQCAYLIPKGGLEAVRAAGLDAFRAILAGLVPWLAGRVDALADWSDVKLLTVQVNRLRRWHRPGFLAIGDAAHAMSPVGGVGINLAVQDAVAAANVLVPAWRRGVPTDRDLAAVQRRREWPTVATQRLQVLAQDRMLAPALAGAFAKRPPLGFRLVRRLPVLRRVTARLIGIGLRPEHLRGQLRSHA